MTVSSVVFGASALLLMGLAIPLVQRRVRPNRVYGFRTPETLKDERLWYDVNAKTGVDQLVVSVGLLGLAIGNGAGAFREELTFVVVSLAWMGAGMVACLVHGSVITGRHARSAGKAG